MKNNLTTSLFFSFFLILSISLDAQDSKFTLELRGGINNSDVNYGIEELSTILPLDDYPNFFSSGVGNTAFSFGLGGAYALGKHVEFTANIDYTRYNYDVVSTVMTAGVTNLFRPEVISTIFGNTSYNYLNIETGIRYSLSEERNKGFFFGAFVSNMFHLDTDWKLRSIFENGVIDNNADFSQNQERIDFKNLFFLGLNTGYKFKLKENFSLSPVIDFRYGLNSVVESNESVPSPLAVGYYVMASWQF